MVSLEQLKAQIAAYASGNNSLGDFEDWFYEHSIDPLDSSVEELVDGVDIALSSLHFGHRKQAELRKELQELANASRPFVSGQRFRFVVVNKPQERFLDLYSVERRRAMASITFSRTDSDVGQQDYLEISQAAS